MDGEHIVDSKDTETSCWCDIVQVPYLAAPCVGTTLNPGSFRSHWMFDAVLRSPLAVRHLVDAAIQRHDASWRRYRMYSLYSSSSGLVSHPFTWRCALVIRWHSPIPMEMCLFHLGRRINISLGVAGFNATASEAVGVSAHDKMADTSIFAVPQAFIATHLSLVDLIVLDGFRSVLKEIAECSCEHHLLGCTACFQNAQNHSMGNLARRHTIPLFISI